MTQPVPDALVDAAPPVEDAPDPTYVPAPWAPHRTTAPVLNDWKEQRAVRKANAVEMFDADAGEYVPVAHAQVADAFKSGKYRLAPGSRVPVKLEDGTLGTVPAESLSDALDSGATIAAPDEVYKHEQREHVKGAAGGAKAFASGVLRTVPGFGGIASASPTGAFGEEAQAEARDELEAQDEEHPWLGLAGEALPSAGIGALGGLAEGGVKALVGDGATSILGRVAQRAAPAAARMGVEGALYGAKGAINDAVVSGDPLTAESIYAGMGHGGFMGGALGAAFGGIGGAFARRGAKVADEAIEGASRIPEADAGSVESVLKKNNGWIPEGIGAAYTKAASAASGGEEEFLTRAGAQNASPEARALRSELLPENTKKLREDMEREIRQHVDASWKAAKNVDEEAMGGLKEKNLRPLMPKDEAAVTAISNETKRIVDGLKTDFGVMASQPQEFGLPKALGHAKELVERYDKEIWAARVANDPTKQFILLDEMKRALQKYTKSATQGLAHTADPLDIMLGNRTRDAFFRISEDLRGQLENTKVWGEAGKAQKDINALWTERLGARERFEREFMTEGGRNTKDPYRKEMIADPAKISKYVANLKNPRNDLAHETARDYLNSTRKMADAVSENYALSPEKMAEVNAVRKATTDFHGTIDRAEKHLTLANQLEDQLASERANGGVLTGALTTAGAVLGGGAGAAAGAGLGALAGTIARPGATLLQMARVERMAQRFQAKLDASVGGFFRPKSAAKVAGKAASKIAKEELGLAPTRAERREEFEKTVRDAHEFVSDEDAIPDKIASRVSALNDVSPHASSAVASVATRIAILLAKNAPKIAIPDPLGGTMTIQASQSQQDQYLDYAHALKDPKSVLAAFEHGTISAEQVRAMKDGYPAIYQQLQEQAMDGLARLRGSGHDATYQQRLVLGTLFGKATDPTMTPAAMQSAQIAFATKPQPPQGAKKPRASKPLHLADQMSTETDKLAQETNR